MVAAVLAIVPQVSKNPLFVDFCTKNQHCMNALDFYGVLLEWTWNHVTDWNMYLIQSATTACALSWYVTNGQIGGCNTDISAGFCIELGRRYGSQYPS